MINSVLMVDDEANVLEGIGRQLRNYNLATATSGQEGLQTLKDKGPFAVVVSDMQMPEMNGAEFLAQVQQQAPQTIRIMLTGNADQKTAAEAVNEGAIFRFLTKPCPPESLAKALDAGIEQYRLVTSEKELLSQTLTSAISILTEVLSIVNPSAFGRASRIRPLVRHVAEHLEADSVWEIEIAAMLSLVGCVATPESDPSRSILASGLSVNDSFALMNHPQIARDLISKIPRLNNVATIVYYQDKNFNGQGFPDDDLAGENIPLGGRILKAALDYDFLVSNRLSDRAALQKMEDRQGHYDPRVFEALVHVLEFHPHRIEKDVYLSDLPVGGVLSEAIVSHEGVVLINKGQEVTESLRTRLLAHAAVIGVHEPVRVLMPA